jgi:hypothetical protein
MQELQAVRVGLGTNVPRAVRLTENAADARTILAKPEPGRLCRPAQVSVKATLTAAL